MLSPSPDILLNIDLHISDFHLIILNSILSEMLIGTD